jgi:hypothetical protein
MTVTATNSSFERQQCRLLSMEILPVVPPWLAHKPRPRWDATPVVCAVGVANGQVSGDADSDANSDANGGANSGESGGESGDGP